MLYCLARGREGNANRTLATVNTTVRAAELILVRIFAVL